MVLGVAVVGETLDPERLNEILGKLIDHPLGVWILVIPGQIAFLLAALLPAILSPVPFRDRLRLGKGRLPLWTWLVFPAATPCIGILIGLLFWGLGIEPSEQLKMMDGMFRKQTGLALLACVFLIAVLPGLAEELLFRGYMQGRLLRRWSPVAAIFLSSLFFAVAHLDPVHVMAVFPLGVWMGVIAYRTESIWPAIICHMMNNLLALILSQLGLDTFGFGNIELMIIIPSAIALVASLYLLFLSGGSEDSIDKVIEP